MICSPSSRARSKNVYEAGSGQLEFVFSNRISVFDKIIPSEIPHKGETLARTSAYWFGLIKKMGIPSHYIKLTAPNRMLVKKVNVINDYTKLNYEKNVSEARSKGIKYIVVEEFPMSKEV
jgi:phosphoribosylaminoimidazole-succinocarboxamide synthase